MKLLNLSFLFAIALDSVSGAAVWPPDGTFQKTVLKHHNIHRKNHSAHALQWSPKLKESAKILASRCVFAHDTSINGGHYGQNLAAGVQRSHISESITTLFYNGEEPNFRGLYGQANPPGFETWGHFSQIVWKGTTHVACAVHDCSHQGLKDAYGNILPYPPYLTVCNYHPAGNVEGEYGKNIGKPKGLPTVDDQY